MQTFYLASPHLIPPQAATWLEAVAARGVWDVAACSLPENLALADRLHLQGGPGEVICLYTVGQGIPTPVLDDWLPWAGAGLQEEERCTLLEPAATLRIDTDTGGEQHVKARWGYALAAELAMLLGAVLVDVESVRIWSPQHLERFTQGDLDVRSWVSVHAEPAEEELYDLHTHGLRRFGGVDLEVGGVLQPLLAFGVRAMNELACHQVLGGHQLRNGERVLIDEDYAFALSSTVRFADHCQNQVLALVDPPDAPFREPAAPRNTLARVAQDVAAELLEGHRLVEAQSWLTAALQLAPWRPSAHEARAALHLTMGDLAAQARDLEGARQARLQYQSTAD